METEVIDAATIAAATGVTVPGEARFERLGWTNSVLPETLSFIDEQKYLSGLLANPNVTGVFATPPLTQAIRSAASPVLVLECDDPRWAYHVLHNHVAKRDYVQRPASVAATADIHPAAFVADHNVTIGERTIVAANATVLPDVTIGDDCVIQAGAVVGSIGFEHKRTSRGLVAVCHDGEVLIGNRVEIGANSCVDKGFRDRPTVVADDVRVDNLVHIAHSVRIGRGTLVTAGTIFAGSSEIGEGAWLSINSSVGPALKLGDRAFVSMAAAVGRDVGAGEQVTGNLALPHKLFLKIFKRQIRDASRE